MAITANDIRDFNSYLRQCTNSQVHGVYEKERDANREEYMALAEQEATRRGIELED